MSSYRSRGHSPPRYYGEQPRATTGTVYVTSFDTGTRGGSSSSQPRTSVSGSSSGRHSVTYQAQPMRKSTLGDGKTKTEYAIRPRQDSYNPPESRRPSRISTRDISPPRRNPVLVASPREATPTVVRDDSSRLLSPAVSHGHHYGFHQRHNSTSNSDMGPRDALRDKREKSYQWRPSYTEKGYYDNRLPTRGPEDEEWSYTGPREQFDRDYPQRIPSQRDEASRRERPLSHYPSDRPSARREPETPTSSSRHLVKYDRREPDHHSSRAGFDSDPDRGSETPRKRHSIRQPVLHQQSIRDDGYSSARDDHDSRIRSRRRMDEDDNDDRLLRTERRRDHGARNERADDRSYHKDSSREKVSTTAKSDYDRDYERDNRTQDDRRKPRSREHSPERSGLKEFATGALGTMAAGGVMRGAGRDQKDKIQEPDDEEQKDRKHRRRRHKSRKDDQYDESDPETERRHRSRREDQFDESEHDSDRRHKSRRDSHHEAPESNGGRRYDRRTRSRGDDSSGSETPDNQHSRRSKSHTQHKEDEEASNRKHAASNGPDPRAPPKERAREQDEGSPDADRPSREMVLAHKQDQDGASLESRTISPGENEDDRPRRVQLVEPVKGEENVRPKGILKPARQVPFPEDPNPIREGVAPLKDATKDGIPPNARWTKINRVLVNPEALEKAQERFEEREDYVIVLRVLSREEIKKLAEKTKEIRATREREWQNELKDRKRRTAEKGGPSSNSDDEIDYNRDESDARPQLAIEQAPPASPADPRNLQSASNQQMSQRGAPAGSPVPEINVDSNYSQNV